MWSMAEHARLANDPAWLTTHKRAILDGCQWILRERNFSKQQADNPCRGLLYGKFVCDMPDSGNVKGVGYFAYADAISYLGLHEMAQLLAEWGHPEGAGLLKEAENYRQDIVAAVDRLTDKSSDPWYVPWALHAPKYKDEYLNGVCGPINLAFGRVLSRDDPRIAHVIRWNIDHIHKGSPEESATANMFYSQDLAIILLEQGRVEEFLRMFYTILAANVSHQTLTTCEWRNNTQPHVHSISSLIRMFRTMMIQERDGGLYLLQGTPRRWLEDNKEIDIRELPTWYGPLSLHCVSHVASGSVGMRLQVPERLGSVPIHLKLRLPAGLPRRRHRRRAAARPNRRRVDRAFRSERKRGHHGPDGDGPRPLSPLLMNTNHFFGETLMHPRTIRRLLLAVSLFLSFPLTAVRAADRPVKSLPAHLLQSGIPTESEIALVEGWLKAVAAGRQGGPPAPAWFDHWIGAALPFSFRYAGEDFTGAGSAWQFHGGDVRRQADVETREWTWLHTQTGLKATWHIKRFLDYPAVDTLLTFENTGGKDTSVVEDVKNLDLKFNHSRPGKNYTIHGAHGGRCGADDFMPFTRTVAVATGPSLSLLRQDFEKLEINRSVIKMPLMIGGRKFEHGLGTHSVSRLCVRSPKPIVHFSAWVGVDHNERTRGGQGSVVFSVSEKDRPLFKSDVLRGGQEPVKVDLDTKGAKTLYLDVGDAGDGPSCDHADWADGVVTFQEARPLAWTSWRVLLPTSCNSAPWDLPATRSCRSSISRRRKAAASWSASDGPGCGRPNSPPPGRNWRPRPA